MENLVLGTKETMLVTVVDRLGNLATLDGLVMKFDVIDREGNKKINQQAATNAGMIAQCLVDTSAWLATDKGKYQLYLDVTSGAEKPRLGPFEFEVA